MKKILMISFILFGVMIFAQEGGRKAPNFKLDNINGETVQLNDYLGEGPVLVCFWATWCKPCLEELKKYNKTYKKYAENGLKMVAISNDNERSIAKVKPFIKRKGYSFDVLLDPNTKAAKKYYANNVPHTIIINKDGNIVYSHSGYKPGDEKKVIKILIDLLNEK